MEHPVVIDSEGRIGTRPFNIFVSMKKAVLKAQREILEEIDANIFKQLDAANEYADEIYANDLTDKSGNIKK